ncbi:S49 family peptidase [Methylobacterium nodulans]|uniref:Peptidase S49 n=1 Tax=Methylobacterium nodulans (strain LMG 21967 / CNCM I-2342 / ORS 2060) TaxID=460265 RepID=B8IT98_METNO|nr:S49 family peptidase [Methylobacterium nodulans]ACL56984.1 peptidase S49 [Methylobacterium nodulans ORS 2060]
MKYGHILMAVTEERWALREAKLQEIVAFLEAQADGVKFSAEEVQARISNAQAKEVARREGAVAVLPLRGVIANRMNLMGDISGGTSAEAFRHAFQGALRDPEVKAIVLDVDSPGGAVSGSDELSSMIFAARGTKPIVAHVDATAASAAYWIASAADEVVVTPTGAVGSIGVFGIHDDLSGAREKLGVKRTIISAGRFKADGVAGPLDDAALARRQARVEAAYDMFVRAVARNRNVSLSAVRDGFGQGDMVDAAPAVAEGMADRLGTLDETLQRLGASQYRPAPAARRAGVAPRRALRALDLS